jgi:hypothetical protein
MTLSTGKHLAGVRAQAHYAWHRYSTTASSVFIHSPAMAGSLWSSFNNPIEGLSGFCPVSKVGLLGKQGYYAEWRNIAMGRLFLAGTYGDGVPTRSNDSAIR